MNLETDYKVESVTRTTDCETFEAWQHIPSGTKGRHVRGIEVPEGVDVEPGDVVRLRVENHSTDSWTLDTFIGFPYDKERGWEPFDGIGN